MSNLTYANTIAIQRSNISKNLIEYANSAISEFDNNVYNYRDSTWYKAITKARKEYKKRFKYNIYHDYDVSVNEYLVGFCIPFTAIPDRVFRLMEHVRWIHWDSKEPINNKGVFYCSKWHDDTERKTICDWYIDFDGYVDLLILDICLHDFYLPNEVA